jgi:Spy/CpxP family protein refolding chaperone
MNRWMRNTMLSASLAGVLAIVPGAIAYAHDGGHEAGHEAGHHGHRGGVLQAALGLDSLSAEQRASIEQLVAGRRTASVPVRQADAQVLTVLAQQVEGAAIDPAGLAPSLSAEQAAADAEAAVERDTLGKLHSILTPVQRGQLVDKIGAAHSPHEREHDHAGKGERSHEWFGPGLDLTADQKAAIHARLEAAHQANPGAGPHSERGERGKMLEAFRGDTFDPTAFVVAHNRGEHMEKLAAVVVPVLTPAQRATLATHLRERAAHESKPRGA